VVVAAQEWSPPFLESCWHRVWRQQERLEEKRLEEVEESLPWHSLEALLPQGSLLPRVQAEEG
jgi:hypothetical protein